MVSSVSSVRPVPRKGEEDESVNESLSFSVSRRGRHDGEESIISGRE